ncbi:MAG: hypothetical protein Q8922_11685 [Bacteroidota bacterium]|nr:hypothetical protein [Bacteroidota bacterium]MDP4234657.1 hypothetical protein [Bacteroidota bacterium]MDP4243822.1 hypothetical protein [Bacteroidota bacterium]MDP4288587.1 hypothetical protein [Bacteroidota bacterium]
MRVRALNRMMESARPLAALACASLLFSACAITRTETDYWTITDRDTTSHIIERLDTGAFGNNGVIFPSARTTDINRHTVQHDSTYDRKYPNFLRAGGLETAGLIGSSSSNGLGFGMFGLYSMFSTDQFFQAHKSNSLFKGELLRLSPMEYWLRWFGDAPDWTIGWTPVEFLAGDEKTSNQFISAAANLYLRHRTYLRSQIPYLILSPFVGVSALPSAYINAGAELTLGSYGGLSARLYAGLAGGIAWWIPTTSNPSPAPVSVFPYIGVGMSIMDFINKPDETEREWKSMIHSAININIFEVTLTKNQLSGLDSSFFNDNIPFQGLQVRLANVQFPLPILNDHFWAGTSLLSWVALGFSGQGLGVLPLEIGYRQYLFGAEDLVLEPFFEWSYYPSSFINVGARLKLDTYSTENIGITFGYATGTPGALVPSSLNSTYVQNALAFGSTYIGVSIYLGDWNKSPETIRALHATAQ